MIAPHLRQEQGAETEYGRKGIDGDQPGHTERLGRGRVLPEGDVHMKPVIHGYAGDRRADADHEIGKRAHEQRGRLDRQGDGDHGDQKNQDDAAVRKNQQKKEEKEKKKD